jgi:glycosyltransferase involved in cell wall biosynthesis
MRCGVGDYTGRLVQALHERADMKVRVLTSRLPDAAAADPAWLHRVMPSWRIEALPQYLAVAREFRPDIVHLQYPTQGYRVASGPVLIPLLARLRLGAGVVETWHEFPPPGFGKQTIAMWGLAAPAQAVIYVRPDYPKHVSGILALALGGAPLRFIPNASVIPVVRLSSAERSALRVELGCDDRRIVSFFGFAYPSKGVDQLFQVADPEKHHLLLIGELLESDPYHRRLRELAGSDRWRGKVTIAGFAEPERVARLLAASDAAVFPFRGGGGMWNSSLHAATSQGTFTIVTSSERHGYAADQNVYYAAAGAIDDMRAALTRHAGTRTAGESIAADSDWADIARAHAELYRSVVGKG